METIKANIRRREETGPYGETGFDNGRNYGGDKEMVGAASVVAIVKGELREMVTARLYMGRSSSASVVYASVWIKGTDGHYSSGSGSAGGGGYHKASAALADALESAGVELSEHIGGRGDRAMHDALTAAAKALGARGKIAVYTHGSF